MTPPESNSPTGSSQRCPRASASTTSTSSVEMQGSFLEYAYSVIYSRALPDARDGLKPVQRRILYQMSEMGLRPDRGHVKSARVVGDVMGQAAPARRHGDLRRPRAPRPGLHDARAARRRARQLRLARRRPGRRAVHRGPPASRRPRDDRLRSTRTSSTSCPTTTTSSRSPTVLPAAFPNLLVNGASGIAVGMATNMAPHNLIEVVGRRTTPARRTRRDARRPHGLRARSRPADRRHDRRPRRHQGRLRDRPRQLQDPGQGDGRAALGRRSRPRRHRAALPGRAREGHREDQGRRQLQEDHRHRRRHRPDRPQARPAARHRHQDRLQPGGRARAALPPHPARRRLLDQQRRARRRRPADARAARAAAGLPRPPDRGRHPSLRSTG